jgi:hypothetical protein
VTGFTSELTPQGQNQARKAASGEAVKSRVRVVSKAAGILWVAAVLCSCVSVDDVIRPQLPDSLSDKGLVVAEMYGIGLPTYLDVTINNRRAGFVNGSGYYALPLPPGTYTLNSFSTTTSSSSGGFGGVNVTTSNVTFFPINRSFAVRPGEITNLGEIILFEKTTDPNYVGPFATRVVDNNADTRLYFQTTYPKLLASAKAGTPTLALGDYVQGADLGKMRAVIALALAKKPGGSHYVAGPAGTLAAVDRDKSGKPLHLHLIDAGVMAGIAHAAENRAHDRFAFVTSDGRLFVMRAGKVEQRRAPLTMTALSELYLAGDRDIVISERGLNLYTSIDDGLTWKMAANLTKPGEFAESGFAEGESGYFVYQSYPARMLYAPIGSSDLQPVSVPPDAKEIRRVTALKSTLVLEIRTMSDSARFYVRAIPDGDWQTRHMPKGSCNPIEFENQAGDQLRTTCGPQTYESADGGMHWISRS